VKASKASSSTWLTEVKYVFVRGNTSGRLYRKVFKGRHSDKDAVIEIYHVMFLSFLLEDKFQLTSRITITTVNLFIKFHFQSAPYCPYSNERTYIFIRCIACSHWKYIRIPNSIYICHNKRSTVKGKFILTGHVSKSTEGAISADRTILTLGLQKRAQRYF
jgi:hypothetical protein